MFRTFAVALLPPLLTACSLLASEPAGIVPADLDVVPESTLEPRDARVETEEAEGALLDDPGIDRVAIVVDSAKALARVELAGEGEGDRPFLDAVVNAMQAGLADATYVLLFEPAAGPPPTPNLRGGPERLPLVGVSRIDRTVPTCTTMVSTRAEAGEDAVGYGARIGALTEGICGGIAVLHSWIELGATTRAAATHGASFRKKAVDAAQGSNREKMTHRFLRRQHERVGATDCRSRPGAGATTSNRQGLELFLRDLSALVNDPNHTWDCTLFVRTRGRDGDLLAHFEHIESVRQSGGSTLIRTTNGFAQGNGRTTVPASPGTNTWTASPGGNPACRLTGTTATRPPNLVGGVPNVGIVNYLCCKKP